MELNVEVLASEIEVTELIPRGIRLMNEGDVTLDLIGDDDEILAALQRVAEFVGLCGADVTLRDPGPEELIRVAGTGGERAPDTGTITVAGKLDWAQEAAKSALLVGQGVGYSIPRPPSGNRIWT